MDVFVYKSTRGDTILDEIEDDNVAAIVASTIDEIKANGFTYLTVKPIDKRRRPTIFEVKVKKVRMFYFTNPQDSSVNITSIDPHKDTKKTPSEYKDLARERVSKMKNGNANKELV